MTHVPTPVITAGRKAGLARRLAGFGAAGFAAALVAAPMAHAAPPAPDASSDGGTPLDAATPTDTPTGTATSPTSPAPTSGSPTSGSPTSGAPTSTPAPTSSAPTSPAPSSTPTSAAPEPTTATPKPRAKKAQAAPQAAPTPDYGAQKINVGIQLKSDGSYPVGASLAGAVVHIVETDINGVVFRTEDCTPTPATPSTAACEPWVAQPGDSVVFTQTAAPAGPGILLDPVPNTVGPCVNGIQPPDPDAAIPYCGFIFTSFARGSAAPQVVTRDPDSSTPTVTFTDPGVPPVAEPDSAGVATGRSTDIYVTANDSSGYAQGSDVSVAIDSGPAHGTAVVDGLTVHYTPDRGYGGIDSFRYTITAPNGSSSATATITVTAPPIATNNAARTVGGSGAAGRPVTIPVLANDSANGGGKVTLVAVGNPPHGTAVIRGADIVYTPDAGFAGTDVFSYTIRTANGTATATIRVTVTAPVVVAPAPVAPAAAAAAAVTDPLASTGAPSEQLLGVGSLLLLVGGGATVAGRRRRSDA